MTSSSRCAVRKARPRSFTCSRISLGISNVGGLTNVRWAPSSARAYVKEWTVRPYRRSPTKVTFCPSIEPFSSQIVYRSNSVCVGCCPAPSPALITGRSVNSAARRAAPSCGWRRTIASLYDSTIRIVSASVSPFWTEVPSVPLKPRTRPPRRAIALSKEARPRRGLVEQRREDLPFQGFGPTAARRDGHHLLRGLQDEFDVRPRQVANREDVASLEAGHQAPYSEVQLKGYPRGPRSIGTALGLRAAPRSRLRILPAQLGDVRGQDHDAAFGFHVPLPVRRVLLRLLRALDRDRGDDLPHDLVNVDAENLAEQVLHAFAVHVSAAIRRPL